MNGDAPPPKPRSAPPEKMIVTIIYGPPHDPDRRILSQRHIDKMPRSTASKLPGVIGGETAEGPNFKVTRVGGSRDKYEMLLRLQQYIENEDYTPFKPAVPLEVVAKDGKSVVWSCEGKVANGTNGFHADSNNEATHTTDQTHHLFCAELRLYAFAIQIDYTQLKNHSMRRILMGVYPIFTRELLALLELAYVPADRAGDTELVDYITTSTKKQQSTLAHHPDFLALLRKRAGPDPLGKVLLDTFIMVAQTDALLAGISIKREDTEDGEVSVQDRAPAKSSPSNAVPTSPAALRKTNEVAEANRVGGQLTSLVNAVQTGTLVVAAKDGYGTLLAKDRAWTRNRNFLVLEGELLVAEVDRDGFNGRNNVYVHNARGETGDVLRSLLRVVPSDLGTFGAYILQWFYQTLIKLTRWYLRWSDLG